MSTFQTEFITWRSNFIIFSSDFCKSLGLLDFAESEIPLTVTASVTSFDLVGELVWNVDHCSPRSYYIELRRSRSVSLPYIASTSLRNALNYSNNIMLVI